jgi:5-methylcytosine-specific restriction endonuclease McrA
MTSNEDAAAELADVARAADRLVERVAAGAAARGEVDVLVAELRGMQVRHFGSRPRARRGEGAKWQMLEYLRQRVGTQVHGEELEAVGGIGEWARRVRELRVEHGYDIEHLGASVYVLHSAIPDGDRARQWQTANRIRRSKKSAMAKVLEYLSENVGDVVRRDQIDYVAASVKEATRRLRQLRDEEGWPIESHIDDPTLRPSEYRLASVDPDDRRDPAQRLYEEGVRQQVYERDNYSCRVCGRNRETALRAGDRRFYLEIHHRTALADELAAMPADELNNADNLITLCHADHVKETAKLQRAKRERRRSS